MCGLFGIYSGKVHQVKAKAFLKDAFVASMLRGTDSSGLAVIDHVKSKFDWNKMPVPGSMFTDNKSVLGLLEDGCKPNTISIAHVRAATVGKVTVDNAHPFVLDKSDDTCTIIGAHNGTLTGWQSDKLAREFDVDSEWAIAKLVEEKDEAFQSFKGAYAFTWWDSSSKDVLHMARNKERSLTVAFLPHNGLAWASEAGMLYWLLERNGIKLDGNMIVLEAGQHYSFNLNNVKEYDKVKIKESKSTGHLLTSTAYESNYNYSTIDRVEKVLDRYAAKGKPAVTKDELELAKDYGIFNEEVEFTPDQVNTKGELHGLVEYMGVSLEGVIRVPVEGRDMQSTWICKCIGYMEEEGTLVLSKPLRVLQSEPITV